MPVNKRVFSSLLVMLMLLAVYTPLKAQKNISPDRPGIGDGSYIVQPRVTYLETGIEYFNVDNLDQFS
ncbi:MAG: hypothetical protein ACNS64_15345, partial [Candidatus Halalkalibacterium sp. M3_1C_030]